jgi:hypothetical protein
MRGEMNVFDRFFNSAVQGCSVIGLTFREPGICQAPKVSDQTARPSESQ